MRKALFGMAAFAALALVGCGGIGDNPIFGDKNPRLSAYNATEPGTVLRFDAGLETVATGLTYMQMSGEKIISHGNHTVTVTNTADGDVLSVENRNLELNTDYLLLAYTAGSGNTALSVIRQNKDFTPLKGEYRLISTTAAYGEMDVFVYRTADMPLVPSARLTAAGQSSNVLVLDPGVYKLKVFRAGQWGTALVDTTVDLQTGRTMMGLLVDTDGTLIVDNRVEAVSG